MFLRRLLLTMLMAALLLSAAMTAAAAPRHWASDYAARLTAKLGLPVPADLDTPVPVLEWNRMVARVAGVPSGDAEPGANPRQSWVWLYTGGITPGSMVIRREDAIGGLMKLTSLLYQEQGFTADPKLLDAYGDGAQVSDRQRVLVAGAIRLGFVTGYPGAMLYPQRPLTYAEGFVLISRLLDRYEAAFPLPRMVADSNLQWPRPRGFGAGTEFRLPPEQVINAGWAPGTVGPAWWVINGAGYTAELPAVGAAPSGKVWLVVDSELINFDRPPFTIEPDSMRFVLNDAQMSKFEYPVDEAASAALGSPFGKETVTLAQGASLRGFLVFAVPAGTQGIWMEADTMLGQSPDKPTWSGMMRTPLGDLPGL